MTRDRRYFATSLTVLALIAGTSIAGAQQFSNNWNTSACGFTDTAALEIGQALHLS